MRSYQAVIPGKFNFHFKCKRAKGQLSIMHLIKVYFLFVSYYMYMLMN